MIRGIGFWNGVKPNDPVFWYKAHLVDSFPFNQKENPCDNECYIPPLKMGSIIAIYITLDTAW